MLEFSFNRQYTTRVLSYDQLSELSIDVASSLLLYDECLSKNESFKNWIGNFPFRVPLQAGESLKSLSQLEKTLFKINDFSDQLPLKSLSIIAIGGGSVGDFCGFLASIFKRGVGLIHIPSTWLAAIDSSHGGKTALNFFNAKNQVGSFYPANQVFLVKELLQSQPMELAYQALSEMYKMILIDHEVSDQSLLNPNQLNYDQLLWKYLIPCVEAKYKIVLSDPFEQTGVRQILNLGHTFGHVVESYFSLSHGESVARGLIFTLKWSEKKYLNKELTFYKEFLEKVFSNFLSKQLGPIPKDKFISLALKDKKLNEFKKLNFVFIKGRGDCIIESLTIDEFLEEAIEQGVVSHV